MPACPPGLTRGFCRDSLRQLRGARCARFPQDARFGSDVSKLVKRAGTEAMASMSPRPPAPPPPSLKLPTGQRARGWPWAELPAGIAPRPVPVAAAGWSCPAGARSGHGPPAVPRPRLPREIVRAGWKGRCQLHPAPGSNGMLVGTGAGS